MPVRKIPKNYSNLTGQINVSHQEELVGFESKLERDFYYLLDFDHRVASFEEQPTRISYTDNGSEKSYTPDVFVEYYPEYNLIPHLYEVKYRTDIKRNWTDLKPKFLAGIRYAKKRGWRFRLATEVEINGPLLDNARFLRRYRGQHFDESILDLILSVVGQNQASATPESILNAISRDKWKQASILPSIWYLIANKNLITDLSVPLLMTSQVEVNSRHGGIG